MTCLVVPLVLRGMPTVEWIELWGLGRARG